MADLKPRILTIRLSEQVGGTGIIVEHGPVQIEKSIPVGEGLVRLAAIFDGDGKLTDAEIITQKV